MVRVIEEKNLRVNLATYSCLPRTETDGRCDAAKDGEVGTIARRGLRKI